MVVTIYGGKGCRACEELVKSYQDPFVYIDVYSQGFDMDSLPNEFFMKDLGNNKIPQVYIDGKYVGRC